MWAMSSLLRERPDPAIEIVRLDRPAQRNAMDSGLLAELIGVLDGAATDPDLVALVFSTTDVRALSAGADMSEELSPDAGVARMEAFTRLYAALDETPVVTIAVCVGNCVGAGAELAAGCDIRVGGDNLKLAWVGARHGVPVGPARLVPLVGLARAKELVLTGRVIGADEARDIGFLQHTAAPGTAEGVAVEVARAVATNSRDSLRTAKRMFRDLEGTAARVAYENEALVDFQRHGAGLPRRG
jgi:enoyl-CoA hydratase/carnithine racemase